MGRQVQAEFPADEDIEYRDFIDSISVTQDELTALIAVPGVESIEQARAYVRTPDPAAAPDSRLAREKERLGRNFRHFMTGLSLTLMELRHGRNHRHT